MRQAARYFNLFGTQWSCEDCEQAAALDLVLWQRDGRIKSTNRWDAAREVVTLLEGLEEVADQIKRTKP